MSQVTLKTADLIQYNGTVYLQIQTFTDTPELPLCYTC